MKKITFIISISILLFGCPGPDDDFNIIPCDKPTIISAEEFNNAPNDEVQINSLEILENCLTVNFSASGCDGNTWIVELYDADEVLETEPLQRRLRFSLQNNELCEAYITKEISFNIINLQVNANQVLLNITNSDDQILYEY
jgi:hypothetical protein